MLLFSYFKDKAITCPSCFFFLIMYVRDTIFHAQSDGLRWLISCWVAWYGFSVSITKSRWSGGVVLPGCTVVRVPLDLFAACTPKVWDNSCQKSFHQVSTSYTHLLVSCIYNSLFLPYCFLIHNQKGTFFPLIKNLIWYSCLIYACNPQHRNRY